MKKLVLAGLTALSLMASDKLLPQDKVMQVLKSTPIYNTIAPRLSQGVKVKGVKKDGFYIITVYDKKGEGSFFVTNDLKYTILGNIIDNKTARAIRPDYPVEKFHGNKDIVKNGVLFTVGHGKKDIYIVTDPECPFCRQFEKYAKQYKLGEKYTMHVIFLPLPFHHHSKAMIYYILSAKTNAEKAKRFTETLSGSNAWQKFHPTKAQKENIDKQIAKSLKAVEELGAKGTPTIYDKNMNEMDRNKVFSK